MFAIALPLALAFIMFALGVSLTPADFRFALRRPHPLLAGLLSQVVLLPLVAALLIRTFTLPLELAVGVLVLACCPGGVTSNVMTRLARGDVALSISFTALASLITTITLPLILTVGSRALLGAALPAVSITGLGLKMFLMTTLPVLLGVLLRQQRPALARAWERPCDRLATGLFGLILVITIAGEWSTLMDHLGSLGPVLLTLNVGMLAIGTAVSAVAGAGASPGELRRHRERLPERHGGHRRRRPDRRGRCRWRRQRSVGLQPSLGRLRGADDAHHPSLPGLAALDPGRPPAEEAGRWGHPRTSRSCCRSQPQGLRRPAERERRKGREGPRLRKVEAERC